MSSKIKVDQIENTSGSGDVTFTGTGGISLSSVKLSTIKSSNGTEGMTITSSGHLTYPKMVIETWLIAKSGNQDNLIGSTQEELDSDWARDTRTGIVQRNVGITQSSGVFSFPTSGIYKVTFNTKTYGNTAYIGGYIAHSTNSGSSYVVMDSSFNSGTASGHHQNTFTQAILDINSTTSRVKFQIFSGATSSVYYRGNTAEPQHACKAYFEQIG